MIKMYVPNCNDTHVQFDTNLTAGMRLSIICPYGIAAFFKIYTCMNDIHSSMNDIHSETCSSQR